MNYIFQFECKEVFYPALEKCNMHIKAIPFNFEVHMTEKLRILKPSDNYLSSHSSSA